MRDAKRVKALDWHRNGGGGLGFHVAIVEEPEDRVHADGSPVLPARRRMLVVRFPKSVDRTEGLTVCAAFDLAMLAEGDIRFAHNSWRGEHYSEVVDRAVARKERAERKALKVRR
jgi:hypothetical protein